MNEREASSQRLLADVRACQRETAIRRAVWWFIAFLVVLAMILVAAPCR